MNEKMLREYAENIKRMTSMLNECSEKLRQATVLNEMSLSLINRVNKIDYLRKQEEEATFFAMCLLMPEQQFKESVAKYTDRQGVHMADVARDFGVTTDFAVARAKQLDLIE